MLPVNLTCIASTWASAKGRACSAVSSPASNTLKLFLETPRASASRRLALGRLRLWTQLLASISSPRSPREDAVPALLAVPAAPLDAAAVTSSRTSLPLAVSHDDEPDDAAELAPLLSSSNSPRRGVPQSAGTATVTASPDAPTHVKLPPIAAHDTSVGSPGKLTPRSDSRPLSSKLSSASLLSASTPTLVTFARTPEGSPVAMTVRSAAAPHRLLHLDRQGSVLGSSVRRRITISVDEISPHALDRLGVDMDMLRKEKGMKKLGISDVDIERSEELRRYSGITFHAPVRKVEFVFGFNDEQLSRDKAIKRLGTTEQEILDDYSRRISELGTKDERPVISPTH